MEISDLVNGTFYFLRTKTYDEFTVGEWKGRYFMVCGCDEPIKFGEFSYIHTCYDKTYPPVDWKVVRG